MTDHTNPAARSSITIDAATLPVRGVLTPRVFAWIVDVLVIGLLSYLIALAIIILGVATLGLGFMLLPLLPLTALAYAALTIGGPAQATIGMRMAGIKVVRSDGGKPEALAAAVHALLFWVATGTGLLLFLDILTGFLRADRRLGHDVLTGLALVAA